MSTELVVAKQKIFDAKVPANEAGQFLATFGHEQQALILRSAWDELIGKLSPDEYQEVVEREGRRLEWIMVEQDAPQDVIATLIEAGDVDLVMNVIRGHAGEHSAIAEHLTVDLINEMFTTDADKSFSRRLMLCYTLLCETKLQNEAVNEYFTNHPSARALLAEMAIMADRGEEDAATVIRFAHERDIPLGGIINSEDAIDGEDQSDSDATDSQEERDAQSWDDGEDDEGPLYGDGKDEEDDDDFLNEEESYTLPEDDIV